MNVHADLAKRAPRARPKVETHSCAEPGCSRQLASEERCTQHGGKSGHQVQAASAVYFGNPWASESPDCPRGHHARRVYRWSYDPADPWPWFCPECKRRFAVEPLVDPGPRRGRQTAGGTPGSVDHSRGIPTLSEGS